MKIGIKLFIISLALLTTPLFAATPINMNIHAMNQQNDVTGNIKINNYTGPILNRNGGTANFSYKATKDILAPVELLGATKAALYCHTSDGHSLALNPNIYTGDTINITFVSISQNFTLSCTCTGSSCDEI